ncbi:MAG: LamG domain-containing protein, partial [Lentimicrobiaceae bacterium]
MKKNYLLIITIIFVFTGFQTKAQSSFSLTTPINGAYASAKPFFVWANSSGATYYQLFIDGVLKKNNIATSYYQLITGEEITQGMHTWYVNAVGTGTIQSNETWSILVDATQPTSFNLISPTDNSWTASLQPTLTWSASNDVSSGLAKYQLWIDGILNRDNIPPSTTSTTPLIDLKNGNYTWEIKSVDNVGNIKSSAQNWVINVDNLPPGSPNVSALSFDGIGLGVDLGNSSLFNLNDYNFTIESWVCFYSGGTGWPVILSKKDGYDAYGDYSLYTMGTGTTRKVGFWIPYMMQITSSATLVAGTFYHIAVTMNRNLSSNQFKLYIDGKLDTQTTISSYKSSFSTAPLRFGRGASMYSPYYSDRFKGIIDDVRFWNFDKTEAQIQKEMNISLRGNESGLIGYWKLDEWDGYVVHDEKLANDGIIYGASYNHSFIPDVNFLCDPKYPINNKFISTTLPTLEWGSTKDAGIGFDKFQLFIDNTMVADNLKDSSYAVQAPLKYSTHEWYLKGFDLLGNNINSQKQLFNVDNVSPMKFDLIAPKQDSIVFLPTPNLSWQATTDSIGGSGISKYQLWINGVKNRDSIPISQTTVAPSSALAQGAYSWFIKAYDNVGNVCQSTQTWTFYVDWEPPTAFTLIDPSDNVTLTVSRPLFKWHKSTDIGSGIEKYELCISGQAPVTILPTDTIKLLTFDLPNGPYTWFVKAYDKAGAFTSSNTNSLTINVTLPGQAATPTGITE